jgi:hypothetical protein
VAPRIDRPSRVVVVESINEDLSVLVDLITNPGETSPAPALPMADDSWLVHGPEHGVVYTEVGLFVST